MIESTWRYTPDLLALALGVYLSRAVGGVLRGQIAPRWGSYLTAGVWFSAAWITFSFVWALPTVYRYWPLTGWAAWFKGMGMTWTIVLVCGWAVDVMFRTVARLTPAFDPGRRRTLQWARTAATAAPAVALGYGAFIERRDFRTREVTIAVPGLAKDLDGLRMVQITDTHMGDFFSIRDMEYAVGMANELKAHIALMTGDLISVRGDPVDECLRLLAKVKADAGMIGCLGNHEIAAGTEAYTKEQGRRLGMRFLRQETEQVKFGNAVVNFAGVDYQRRGKPYLPGADRLVQPGALNVLLSHNPDVFPVAAGMGYELTVSGHTHGGQVTVEILHQYLNVARFLTPYVYGTYERDGRSIYVSRGLGTVGAPVRFGAPPEVALIKLKAG